MKYFLSILFLSIFSLAAFAQNSGQDKIKVVSSSWNYTPGTTPSNTYSTMDSQQREWANESIKDNNYKPSKETVLVEFENTGAKNIKSVEYVFTIVNIVNSKVIFKYKLKDNLNLSPNKRIEINKTFRIENNGLRKFYQSGETTVTIKKIVFSDGTSEKF